MGEYADQVAIAGRDSGIGGSFGTGNQPFGIVCCEKITACRRVPVILVVDGHPVTGLREKIFTARSLVKRERGAAEISVIVDARGMAGPSRAPAMQQTAVGAGH